MNTRLFFLFTFSLLFLGCPKDEECTTCPPPPPPPVVDTTGHNFVWETFVLGDGGGSVLYDVAIINDTLAYAVGEIYLRDSTGQLDPIFYNLAKWNGREWTMSRVYYQGTSLLHPTWILAFSDRDMWITPVTHWDGTRFHDVPFDPIFSGVRTNKAWGTSSSDFYVVGNNGFIAHYDGVGWRQVDLGTTANIFDVWGITQEGKTTVYVPVSDLTDPGGIKKIFRIKNSTIDSLSWNTGRNVLSVWTQDGLTFFAVGDGIFFTQTINPKDRLDWNWKEMFYENNFRLWKVQGNKKCDVFAMGYATGKFPYIMHYNGVNWNMYAETSNNGMHFYQGMTVRGNIVVGVGYLGNRAGAVVGKRSN